LTRRREAIRPNADRYLLALLRDRVFRPSDFRETQRGTFGYSRRSPMRGERLG
jgi:hypothetical protein